MAEINWTNDAEEDLKSIFKFIAQHSVQNANNLINRIIERAIVLANQPYSGHIVPEFKIESVREIHQDSFRIIYKIVSDVRVDILSIQHQKMLLSNNPHFE